MNTVIDIIYYYNYAVLFYFLIIVTVYILLNVISFRNISKYAKKIKYAELKEIFRIHNFKPVTVIVPAYNEENGIVESVRSLLQLEYPDYQLIVVNDGSTDDTLLRLFENFQIRQISFSPYYEIKSQPIKAVYLSPAYPNLVVIDKENGGKADSINAAINISKNPLITVIDADSILERDCLLKIARPFMENENIVAVGGTVRIANGCKVNQGYIEEVGLSKSWLARFQVVEYLRAFLFGRNGFDVLNGILIISGAFSCFKREALIEVGGYLGGSIGEDMEIVIRLHKELRKKNKKTRVTFIPDPVCWTEGPETFKTLASQRVRWQKGTIESIRLHKDLLFNFKYGWLGTIVFPYYLLFEVFGPFIEISGYVVFIISLILNIVPFNFAVAFFTAAFLYGVVLSTLAVCLEELSFKKYTKVSDLLILMAASFLENFGYRQLTAFWRFKGFMEYIFGKRSWGKMEKKGFKKKKEQLQEIEANLEDELV
ncbi:poly-beta-1,6-N-acetyl-D-glucosamine synthase [bacterium BMS3Abin03]|nr:poly-beta-1,6-N-acetyl-D-glucosamine synthase [bacterium BMS3Abin03]